MSDLGELKRLEADLEKDDELRKKFDETVKRIVEEGKAKSDGEVMTAATAELGYNISIADLERASAEGEDIDDAELELIAGGKNHMDNDSSELDEYGHEACCVVGWHCNAAFLHTSSNSHKEACWSSYVCKILYEVTYRICG